MIAEAEKIILELESRQREHLEKKGVKSLEIERGIYKIKRLINYTKGLEEEIEFLEELLFN